MIPGATQPAMVNAPVMLRQGVGAPRNLRGYNNAPGPNGAPGSGVYPYNETGWWGADAVGGGTAPGLPPAIGTVPPALSSQQADVISVPNGQSTRPWQNPTTYAGFPIVAALGAIQAVLTMNVLRNSLIIQNTSSATAPDVAPTLYVGFNADPGLNSGALALPPGLGFYWGASDCPPRDNIFVVFLGGANGGGSVIQSGSVIQGTYIQDASQAPPPPPGGIAPR